MKKLFILFSIWGVGLSSITYIRPSEINITYGDCLLFLAGLIAVFKSWTANRVFGGAAVTTFFGLSVALFYVGFLIALPIGDPLRFLVVAFQYAFCFFFVPYVLSRTELAFLGGIEQAAKLHIYFLAFTALLGFLGYFVANDLMRDIGLIANNGRYQGFVGNPNRFASLICLSLPLLFGLKFLGAISITNLVIVMVCFSAGLIVASSFGGLISALMTLACMGVISFKAKSVVKSLFVLVPLILILINTFGVPLVFEKRVLSKLDGSTDASSLGSYDDRLAVAEEAFGRIMDNPIVGAGLDNYMKESEFGHTVHNTVLLVGAEGGLISLLGLLGLCFVPLITYLSNFKGGVSRSGFALALGFTVALFLTMQVFAHLYSRAWFVPYFLAIGLIVKLAPSTQSHKMISKSTPHRSEPSEIK